MGAIDARAVAGFRVASSPDPLALLAEEDFGERPAGVTRRVSTP